MKYLWDAQQEILQYLKSKKKIILLLDYDGTIVPINSNPKYVSLPQRTKQLLDTLQNNPSVDLGIVSGRTLDDIKGQISIPNIMYCGSHGFEWEIDGIRRSKEIGESLSIVEIKDKLSPILQQFDGAFIEDKRFMLTIHYRMVSIHKQSKFRTIVHNIVHPYLDSRAITLTTGKKTIEVKPAINWDKGAFIDYLLLTNYDLTEESRGVIYIGDDVTDEDVFDHQRQVITIKVGTKISHAKYHLKNTNDTIRFLEWLSDILR